MLFSVEVKGLINFTYHYNTLLRSSLRCSPEAQEANMGNDRIIPCFFEKTKYPKHSYLLFEAGVLACL